jgi:conjugative relaxase-like TrwC/TraI family protein
MNPVSGIEFDTLLRGCNPLTEKALVKNAASEDVYDEDGNLLKMGRGAYKDFTFSADKSVSLLARGNKRIEAAHDRAVRRVAALIEKNCGFFRKVDETTGKTVTIKPNKLVMARFNHYESRENEPQLHSHLIVMNLALCEDGKWRSVEYGKALMNKKYLGQITRWLRNCGNWGTESKIRFV